MKITVNRASLDNVDELVNPFDSYRMFYQQNSDKALARQFLEDRLRAKESVIFYATDADGVCLGFTQLFPTFSSVSAERMWILNDLFVVREARGHGVATQLMDTAKAFAIETDSKGLTLSTAIDNLTAQSLYETLGYERDADFYTYFLGTRD